MMRLGLASLGSVVSSSPTFRLFLFRFWLRTTKTARLVRDSLERFKSQP